MTQSISWILLAVLIALSDAAFGQSAPAAPEPAESEPAESEPAEPAPAEEASAADVEEGAEEPTLDERLDALLSEVSDYEDREPQRCLNLRSYRSVKVLNTEYLLFSRGSSKYWLNKLKRDCPSLRFNDLPVFESRGVSSLCENDPFYPSNSMDLQRGMTGGRPTAMHGICHLGSFEVISPEQAALLLEQN